MVGGCEIRTLAGAASSACEVAADAIEVILDPFRAAIYCYTKLKNNFIPKVQRYLDEIAEENIIPPDEAIAGPILEAVKFKTSDDISSLFAALLASSMDSNKKELIHPAYVQIINEMSADEAKMLHYLANQKTDSYPTIDIYEQIANSSGQRLIYKNFTDLGQQAECLHPQKTPSYIDNLTRLRLVSIPFGDSFTDTTKYTPLKEHGSFKSINAKIAERGNNLKSIEGIIQLTPFGKDFIVACNLGTKLV